MNQTIRQSQAILRGLRYSVVPQGSNTYKVIERPSGFAMGECFGQDSARQLAQQLTNNANLSATSHKPLKSFARALLCWTASGALMLMLFAYYGASH